MTYRGVRASFPFHGTSYPSWAQQWWPCSSHTVSGLPFQDNRTCSSIFSFSSYPVVASYLAATRSRGGDLKRREKEMKESEGQCVWGGLVWACDNLSTCLFSLILVRFENHHCISFLFFFLPCSSFLLIIR